MSTCLVEARGESDVYTFITSMRVKGTYARSSVKTMMLRYAIRGLSHYTLFATETAIQCRPDCNTIASNAPVRVCPFQSCFKS